MKTTVPKAPATALPRARKLIDAYERARAARVRFFDRMERACDLARLTLGKAEALAFERRWEGRMGPVLGRETRAQDRLSRFVIARSGVTLPSIDRTDPVDMPAVALKVDGSLWVIQWLPNYDPMGARPVRVDLNTVPAV